MLGVRRMEFMVLLAHAEALVRSGQPDAGRAVIDHARDHLVARAATIRDPAKQRSFLENVSENARILRLAADSAA